MPPWEKYATPDATPGPWSKYSPQAASVGLATPYSSVDWKAGVPGAPDLRTPDTGPGAGTQIPGGFNEGVARFTEFPERVVGAGLQALHGVVPNPDKAGTPITDWLRSSVPEPTSAGGRFMRRLGETVGANVPYAGLGFLGAPAVAAVEAEGSGALARSLVDAAQMMRRAPGSAAVGELAGSALSGAGAGTVAAVAPGHPDAEAAAELIAPLSVLGAAGSVKRGINLWSSSFSPASSDRAATSLIGSSLGRDLGPQEMAGINRAQELQQKMPGAQFTLAESTLHPDLVATQRGVEAEMTTGERASRREQYAANVAAINQFTDSHAPQTPGTPNQDGPQTVIDAVSGRVQDLSGQIAKQEAAAVARGETAADALPFAGQMEYGAALRDREIALRKDAREAMAARAKELGVNEVDLPAGVDDLKVGLGGLLRSQGDFEDVANRPKVVDDILRFKEPEAEALTKNTDLYGAETATKMASGELRLAKDPATGHDRFVPGDGNLIPTPTGGTTIDSLFKLQSRISDDLRDASSGVNYSAKKVRMLAQVRELVDEHVTKAVETVTDPALKERLSLFRNEYKQNYIDRFNQGVAYKVRANDGSGYFQTPDERVAQSFWGTPSGARQFNTTFRGDPKATAALGDAVLDDLRQKTVRDGQIVPGMLQTWLRNNKASLAQLPAIRSRVDSVADATAALAQRNAVLAGRRTVIEDSALSTRLAKANQAEDPAILAESALKSPKTMAQVLRTVQGDPEASTAWKRMLWDRAIHAQSPDEMESLLSNPQMKQALGEQHIAALKDIFDATKAVGSVGEIPGTSLYKDPYESFRVHSGSGIDSFMAKLWAVETKRTGPVWLSANVLGGFYRAQLRNALGRVLKQALYDPKVAINLSQSLKDKSPISPAAMRLKGRLLENGFDTDGFSKEPE